MDYKGPIEAALTTDLRGEPYNFSVWDTYTGAQLVVFKGAKSPPVAKCVALIDSNYFVLANDNVITIWSIYNKRFQDQKLFLPSRPSCLCMSPCGNYLIAGINESMNIWNIKSGNLFSTTEKHYQPISVIKINLDGTFIVSGGEDGAIHVWCFADLICDTNHASLALATDEDATTMKSTNDPVHSWQNHDDQVTDLVLTQTNLCISVSLDKTVNIYNILSGKRLACIEMPTQLWSIAINKNESHLFTGGQDGNIYQVVISSLSMSLFDSQNENLKPIFIGHKSKVNLLRVSFDGTRLISGSSDSTCKVWSILQRKLIQDIRHQGAIANLELLFVPDALAIKSMSTINPPLLVKPLNRKLHKLVYASLAEDEVFDDVVNIKSSTDTYTKFKTQFNKAQTTSTSAWYQTEARPIIKEDVAGDNSSVGMLKTKIMSLYKFAAEKIFKDAADDVLKTFKPNAPNGKRTTDLTSKDKNNKRIKT